MSLSLRVATVFVVLSLLAQVPLLAAVFDSLPGVTFGAHLALLDLVKGVTVALNVLRSMPTPPQSWTQRFHTLPAVVVIRVAGGSLQAVMLAQSWAWLHSPITLPSIVLSWALVFCAPSLVRTLLMRSNDVGLALTWANCLAAAHTITTSAIDVVASSSSPALRQSLIAPIVIALVAACSGRVVGDALAWTAKPGAPVAWTPLLRTVAVAALYVALVRYGVLAADSRRAVVAAALVSFSLGDRWTSGKERDAAAKRKKQ